MSVLDDMERQRETPAGTAPPSSTPLAGAWRRVRRPGVSTALAALLAVPVTLWILPPPMYADSSWVWRAAALWPDLDGNLPHSVLHHGMRLGTLLPTRLAQELFGPGQTAWVVTAMLLLAAFAAGAYAAGRALFGEWIGWATVGLLLVHPFLTVVNPYDRAVSMSTGSLLPDAPAAGLFALGVAALVVGSRRTGRRQLAWLATAGLCWGVAYLVREYVAFLYLAIPVFFLLLRVPLRRMRAPALPMLLVLGAELTHNAIVWGDPLARLTVAGGHDVNTILPWAASGPLPVVTVLSGFFYAVAEHPLGLLFTISLGITVVGAVLFRDRRLALLVTWFLALWLPLTLLGGLLDPDSPTLRVHLVRYWYVVFPPLVIGALGTAQLAYRRMADAFWLRAAGALAVTALLAVFYISPALWETHDLHRDEDWAQLRSWLRQHPDVPVIYTDSAAGQTVWFYVRSPSGELIWDGEIRTFSWHAATLPTDRIGHDLYLQTKFGGKERPDPAKGWRLVWQSEHQSLTLWQR